MRTIYMREIILLLLDKAIAHAKKIRSGNAETRES